MRNLSIYIYRLFYSHVRGETQKEKIEVINQILVLYTILSPTSVVFILFLIKLGLKNSTILCVFALVYVFGVSVLYDKLITKKNIIPFLNDINIIPRNYIKYYTVLFLILILVISFSLLSVFLFVNFDILNL